MNEHGRLQERVGQRPVALGARFLVPLLSLTTVSMVTSVAMLGPLLQLLAADLRISVGEAGQLGTAMALPWAVTALMAGPVVDRLGPRVVLGVSLFSLGLLTCLCAMAPSFAALLTLRALAGLLGGAAPTAVNMLIAERVPEARRGRAIGWVYAGFPIAAVAAVPAVGAVAGVAGWRSSFTLVGVALVTLAALLSLWLNPDARRVRPEAPAKALRGPQQLRVLLTDRLWLLVIANVCERVAYAGCAFYFATFLMDAYALDSVAVALPLAFAAAGALVGNIVGGQLADRGNRAFVFAATMTVAAACGGALFLVALSVAMSAAIGALFGLANAASRPAFMAIVTSTSSQHRGTALGIISSTSQVGWAVGAGLGGVAYEMFAAPGLAALVAGASLAAALAMWPRRVVAAQSASS